MLVKDIEISTKGKNKITYISLTDIAKIKNPADPRFVVINWLRSKETLSFVGLWEILNNPNFNRVEFDTVKNEAGYNAFSISPSQWIKKTNAIGIISTAGRHNSGTFAHPDIAFEFASWVSSEFKLYLILEFQRLKEHEQKQLEWNARREIAKLNYALQTDAIKEHLIVPELKSHQISYVYASEADMLNVALFGQTAAEWKIQNPTLKGNMRDHTTIQHLLVLANMESYNAQMIKDKISAKDRLIKLNEMARQQLKTFSQSKNPLFIENNDNEV